MQKTKELEVLIFDKDPEIILEKLLPIFQKSLMNP